MVEGNVIGNSAVIMIASASDSQPQAPADHTMDGDTNEAGHPPIRHPHAPQGGGEDRSPVDPEIFLGFLGGLAANDELWGGEVRAVPHK